jgi:hypothetical protein
MGWRLNTGNPVAGNNEGNVQCVASNVYLAVWHTTEMPSEREFNEVQRRLEETLSELKETKDPKLRQLLLRDMRRFAGRRRPHS